MRPVVLSFVLIGLFLLFSGSVFSQVNANSASHAASDAQNQIVVTLSGALPSTVTCVGAACSGVWTVTLGTTDYTPSSVIAVAGQSQVIIVLSTPVGIDPVTHKGQAVLIDYTGSAALNPFTNLASTNNRTVVCADFDFGGLIGTTQKCAPVNPEEKMFFSVKPAARNSSLWNVNPLLVQVVWGNAADRSELDVYESNSSGLPAVDTYFIGADAGTDGYTYPSTAVCGFTSIWTLRTGPGLGTGCGTFSPTQTVTYASWNTENGPGDGTMALNTTVANADRVCLNTNANVIFRDATDLNCVDDVAAPGPIPNNNETRWIRVKYGMPYGGAANTIPNVFVGGVQVTDASGNLMPAFVTDGYINTTGTNSFGTPDAFGVVTRPAATGPAGDLEPITTSSPAGQVDGQRFFVTLEYWNTCNQYDGAGGAVVAPRRLNTRYIEIVQQPAAPLFTNTQVCNATTPGDFAITTTGIANGSTVNWYRNVTGAVPAVAGTVGTSITTTTITANASSIPIGTAFTSFNNTVADNYIVWASYNASPDGKSCESPKVPIVRSVREALSLTGSTIKLPASACPGSSVQFTLEKPVGTPLAPANQPVGGATDYIWTVPAGWNITGGNGTETITVTIGNTSGTVSAVWQYDAAPLCTTATPLVSSAYTVLAPPNASAPTGTNTICEDGTTTFVVAATGAGLTYQWQVDPNTGTFANIPSTGGDPYTGEQTNSLTINTSGTGSTLNNYKYQVIVTGTCSPVATSPARTLTIQPKASISVQPLSGAAVCVNDTKTFTVTASGQPTLTYRWQVDPNTGSFTDIPTVIGDPYSNETTATLSINTSGTGTTMDNYKYRVVVNSTSCSAAATSNQVILSVQGPTVNITNGTTASLCANNNLNLVATESFFNGIAHAVNPRVWTGTYDADGAGGAAPAILTPAQLDALLTNGSGASRRTSLNPVFNSTVTGIYVLTITITDNNNCSNTAQITVNVGEANANILFGPDAGNITDGSLNASICSGANLFLNGNPSGGSGTFNTHTWALIAAPGGTAATLLTNPSIRNPVFNATLTGTYTFSYTVVDNNSCSYTTDPTKYITIVVNALPSAASLTPTAICSTTGGGNTAVVNLTALQNSVNNSGTVNFAWFTDAGLSASISSPATATVTNGVAVYVRVRENALPNCFSVATVTYTVNSRPAVLSGATDVTACSSDILTTPISVTDPDGAGGPITIDWFANPTGCCVLPSGSATATFTPGAAGTYYAEARNTSTGCASTARVDVELISDALPPVANVGVVSPNPTCDDNATLVANTAAPGIGTWSVSSALYNETFSNVNNGAGFIAGSGFVAPAQGGWTITPGNVGLYVDAATDYMKVQGGKMEVQDISDTPTGGMVEFTDWISAPVNISAHPGGVTISIDIASASLAGGSDDGFYFFYRLNGSASNVAFSPSNASRLGSFTNQTITEAGITGNQLQIVVRAKQAGNGQFLYFDNVVVRPAAVPGVPVIADINDPGSTVDNLQVGNNTLTWTITSALGACPSSNDVLIIERLPQPDVDNTLTYDICESNFNTLSTSIDLTAYNTDVAAGIAANRTITWYTNPNLIAGQIMTPANVTASDGDEFYAKVENTDPGNGCDNTGTVGNGPLLNPGKVKINVKGKPAVFAQLPEDCEEIDMTGFGVGTSDNINLNSLDNDVRGAGGLGNSITWFEDPTPGTPVTDQSLLVTAVATPGNIDLVADNRTFYAIVTITATGCQNFTSATYNIKEVPDPQSIIGNDPTCAGTTPQLYTLSNLTTADTYVWNFPADIPGVYNQFGGGDNGDGFLLLQFPSLASPPTADNYLIRVAEIKNGCQGVFNELQITVEGSPTANPIANPGLICKNQDGVTISVTSPNAGNNYSWSIISSPTTASIVGAAAGPGLSSILVDFGSDASVNIKVQEVSSSGCNGTAQTRLITPNDQPSMTSLTTAEICSDEFVEDVHVLQATVTPLTPPNTPLHFDWQVASIAPPGSVSGIVVGNAGTADEFGRIGHALFNVSGIIGTVVYNVTPVSAAGCQGDTKQLTLTVHPKPVLLASQSKTICSGNDVDYEIRLSPPNAPSTTVFNWADPDLAGPASAGVNVPLGASGTLHITDHLINTGSTGSFDVVYNVIPSNPISMTKSCFGTGQNITITVNPEPVSNDPTNLPNICSDVNVNYALQNSITNSVNSTFQWQATINDPDVTGESNSLRNTSSIDDVIINPSGTHQLISYNVTPTGTVALGSCPGDPFTVNLTVERKPVASSRLLTAICSSITTTPVGYTLQSAVTNSVASNFEWLPDPSAAVSGEATSPVTANTITDMLRNTTSIQHSVIYNVTPTAQNDLECPGSSFMVTVPVNPEPVGSSVSLPDFCSQGNVNYSLQSNVNANNSVPSSFEWRVLAPDDNALISGQSTSIQTSATINNTLINVSAVNQGLTYTVTPRSIAPASCLGVDFEITVDVKPEPVGFAETLPTICSDNAPGYVIQTQNINTPPGNSVSSTFVWRPTVDNPDVIGDENLGNRTTSTINEILINTASLVAEDVIYEILPTGTNGCAGEAFEITVPVGPKPVGTTVTAATLPPGIASPDICSQATFTYDLQANINFTNPIPTNFTWSTTSDPFVDNEITTPTSGNTISNALTNLSQFSRTITYAVLPVSVDGCPGDPFNVSVVVKNEPVGWDDITFPAICSQEDVGYDIQNVNLNAAPGNSLNSNFVWKVLGPDNNVNIQNQSISDNANPTINDDLVNITGTDQSLVYTVFPTGKAPNGCVGSSFRVTVVVHPEPVGATANPGAVCSDVAHAIDLQNLLVNPGVASSFTWRAVSDVMSVTGESLTDQNRDFIDDAIKNETALPVTVPYTVKPVSDIGSCEGSAFTVNVATSPEPKGSDDVKTICSGDNVSYSLQNNINGIGNNALPSTFLWKAVADIGDISGESVTNQVPATIGDVLGNISNPGIPLDVTYRITPQSGGCTGDDFDVVVTVSPRPLVPLTGTEAVLCSGLPFSISLQSKVTNNVASNFSWTATYDGVLSGGSGSGSNTISETLSNLGNTQLDATYTVSVANAAAPFCTGTSFTLVKPIDPQPVTDPSLAAVNICSDLPTGIQLNTNGISIGANAWDVDFISVTPNLIPNAANAVDPGSAQAFDYIQNDRYTNTSSTLGFAEYMVTPVGPAANFCRGLQTLVRLEVRPEPVMNPALAASTVVCSDEAIGIVLSTNGTSVAAQSYIYSSLEDPPGTPVATAPGNQLVSGGDRIASVIQDDKYTNVSPTGAALTRAYIVKPKSAANCLGDEMAIPVQVLPEPDFNFAAAPPVCSGVPVNLVLSAATSTPIAKYQITNINWDVLPAPGLLPGGSNQATGNTVTATGSNFTIVDTYTNGTSGTLKAYYKVIPIATTVGIKTCVGNEKTAIVDVLPSPVVDQNLDKIVCNDAVNGITIDTEITSAVAQSFEIVRNPLPAGLGGGVYTPGSQVVNGSPSNNISAEHVINSTDNPLAVTYTVRANTAPFGAGCYGPPETITVTVEPQILVTLSGAPGNINNAKPNICSTDDTEITLVSSSNPTAGNVTFNFTAAPSVPGTISGIVPGSNFDEADIIAQALSNISNGPVDVTYTVTPRANSAAGGNGCVGTPSTTVVKVEPKPRMTASPISLTVCEGVPLGIDFSSVTVPSSGAASMFFQLTAVEDPNTLLPPANVSGFETALPRNYSTGANVLNETLVNTATGQEPIRYLFTPSFTIGAQTCAGDPVSINVMVSPRPVMTPFTIDPKCSGEPFTGPEIDFSSHVTEADLSSTLATWTYVYNPATNMSGASNGAGTDLSQVVFNKNAGPATVTYSIKAKSFNCESNTIQVPVEIYPTPKVSGVPNAVNVCDDGTLNVLLNSTTTGTQYTWVVDDELQPDLTGASDQLTPVPGPIGYLVSNAGTSLGNYTFEITPQVATSLAGKVCAGDPKQLIINVAPPVGGSIVTSTGPESFICSGTRENITMNFDGLSFFEIVYKENGVPTLLTGQPTSKSLQKTLTQTTTFELVSVKDVFGCQVNVNQTVKVNVDDTDATFAALEPIETCSPNKVSFEYDQRQGVVYTWNFDGLDSTAYTAASDELDKIVKHSFENSNTQTVAKYRVKLETKLADVRYPECISSSSHEVRVSPTINVGVFPDIDVICSGEKVVFTNTTRGASSHRWYYRESGTNQQKEVRTAVATAYELVNNTTQNPITYEVVYEADNGKCPTSVTTPITVYRGMEASFDEGAVPPFSGGSATVTFTNTSSPIDGTDFRYEWTFGSNANPDDLEGTSVTVPVTYTLPGLKEVVLVVTNKVAEAAGFSCSDTFSKTIEILLPPLVAAFQAAPLAACFPTNIEITENTSTGDVYKWQVIDQSGNIAATALSPKPIFRIVNPGTYDVFLETSSSITGQTAFAQKTGIEVFDNPLASLEARPTTLFIPDTELITFNFSTGANFYEWDFDDGTVSEDFEPKHLFLVEGTYDVTLVAGYNHGERDIDGDGVMDGEIICYDTARRQVIAKQGGLTKLPNAFTPSKNGPSGGTSGSGTFNDVFLPITKGVAREDGAFVMQIFDRWGTLIFESRTQTKGWDGYDKNGNLVPAGVYVYKLDLRLADGQRTTQVGDVTVIR